MKKNILLLNLLTCLYFSVTAQTTIWSDNFNNGCASNCIATTWNGWTILDNVGGTSGGSPNNWFVSCAEEGVTPPGCGSSCIGDASLHLGANPGAGGDMGASFNETGAANATFRMAQSPIISTVGYSAITLEFDFIAFGSSTCSDDRLQMRLSTDGGATYPAGFQFCLQSSCCGSCNGYSQGQWTHYTLSLPLAFNNNPNVRIGYHWRNNGNGTGTDPSAAIDDITLKSSTPLPIQLLDFSAKKEASKVKLNWTSTEEVDFHHFEVQSSIDGITFQNIGKVTAKGNGTKDDNYYSYYDTPSGSQKTYYRLKMVDVNGAANYSNIINITMNTEAMDITSLMIQQGFLMFYLNSPNSYNIGVEVVNINGQKVKTLDGKKLIIGDNYLSMDISALPSGTYILKVMNLDNDNRDFSTLIKKFTFSN